MVFLTLSLFRRVLGNWIVLVFKEGEEREGGELGGGEGGSLVVF
jgi:hypothetical protein